MHTAWYPLKVIKAKKGVPVTRVTAFKGEQSESPLADKHMTWSLSRNGLYDGDVLLVRRHHFCLFIGANYCRPAKSRRRTLNVEDVYPVTVEVCGRKIPIAAAV